MRNPDRIYDFCIQLANIWKENVPQWRFGQLICNVFGQMAAEGRDPFFPEEKEMMDFFRKFFELDVNDD